MKYYLAPLEGIGNYTFRNAVHKYYGESIDKYYTPFFAPHSKRKPKGKEIREILPENNPGMHLIPQILTNCAQDFLRFESDMHDYGYNEVNINIGCPSPTVVSKNRGAGFLRDLTALDQFLDGVFSGAVGDVSVKTRLGFNDPDEFYEILDLYNKYPIHELIIHFRVQKDYYQGNSRLDYFEYALTHSQNPICYNGDLWTLSDYRNILAINESLSNPICSRTKEPVLTSVMSGRGSVMNPGLLNTFAGSDEFDPGNREQVQKLYEYVTFLRNEYAARLSGDTPTLFKMKEIWAYMIRMFPQKEPLKKDLLKAKTLSQYDSVVRQILS